MIEVSCDEVVGSLERFLGHVVLAHDDLEKAGAVANDEEMNLAARPPVVQPALDSDGLADVLADFVNVNVDHHRCLPVSSQVLSAPRSRNRSATSRTAVSRSAVFSSTALGVDMLATSNNHVPS